MRYILLLGSLLSIYTAQAQTPTIKRPIEQVKAVGRRVIAETPFQYRLEYAKNSPAFDFVQVLDLGRNLGNYQAAGAIAITDISVPRDTAIILDFSFNDGLLAYLNGRPIVQLFDGNRPVKVQQKEREIALESSTQVILKKGANRLVLVSKTDAKGPWQIFLQPKGATIEFSEVKNLKLGLQDMKLVDPAIAQLSKFLIAGPFKLEDLDNLTQQIVYGTVWQEPGKIFADIEGNPTTWTPNKPEVVANVINPHPLWGSFYNFNYHTGGLAWAMAKLSEQSGDGQFRQYCENYCKFMMETKPLVHYQVNTLNQFRSPQHHMINTPLLDFTAAPTMPFMYLATKFRKQGETHPYNRLVDSVIDYVMNKQVRLPNGTFTRETPVKYTTWVDDMFMGIPFVINASNYVAEKDKIKFYNEATKQVIGFNKELFDTKAKLYQHAQYSDKKAKIPFWSRANGWGIWAASEVLLYLPKTHPDYTKVMNIYKSHIDGLVARQDAVSGFWHQILDDPSSYEETSGTAIFTMAIARGINNGWLDKSYSKYAIKGWEAVSSQMGEGGTVSRICIGTMSSEDPNYYKGRPLVSDDSHGLLGVMFAGMEVDKMLYPVKK